MTADAKTIQTPVVKVSWGELFDKITILRIKVARLANPVAVKNAGHELAELDAVTQTLKPFGEDLTKAIADLTAVNETLWVIEDDIRDCERASNFGPRFVELARSVYHRNDERAAVKRRINDLLKSEIIEEKSYAAY
jgi:hypothetical protein